MKVAILSGSVYGSAEDVARHAERQLKAAGFDAWHDPRAQLPQVLEFAPQALLVVTSTTTATAPWIRSSRGTASRSSCARCRPSSSCSPRSVTPWARACSR